jgi:hypothetical protein
MKQARFSGALAAARILGLSVLLVALVLFGPIISSDHVFAYAVDVLSPEDKANLTSYLQQLSLSWVQEAVDSANSILSKETYGPLAWTNFFGEYFAANPLTDQLKFYLQHPIFWWFSDTVHYSLQEGVSVPLLNKIKAIMDAHTNANDLSSALNSDSNLLQTLMNSHRLLNMIVKQSVTDQKRNLIYGFYKTLVGSHLNVLSIAATFDPSTQPYLGVVRAQTHVNLRDTLPLSPQVKSEVAETIELTGSHLNIWNSFSVLIEDNHVLDATQLSIIYAVLDDMPSRLNSLEMITQNDALGNVGSKYQYLEGRWINIFNSPVGASSVDPYVNTEVSSRLTDWFTVVVIHELNHMFAAEYIHEPNGAIDQRELALISEADAVQNRYLASYIFSWFPGYATDDFFVKNPQEFFAYISGVWWADSFHAFELASVRFSANNSAPMNQFLFFADAYSHGSDHTFFYTTDTRGIVTRTLIPITRDAKRHVNSFAYSGIQYGFVLDEYGNVKKITQSRRLSEASAQILSAPANTVYFVYADPYRMVSPTASWSAAFAAYDATAAGFIYGLCANTQRICYDSNASIVVAKSPESDPPFNYGKMLLSSKSVVVMGGPIPNWVVDYYERTGQTPLKYSGNGTYHCFLTQAGGTAAALPTSTDFTHNDLFVVMVFQDTNGNFVLVIYGLGWKGTFAGGIYFKEVIKPNLATYTKRAYVFRWTDAGPTMDGVPQAGEITKTYEWP